MAVQDFYFFGSYNAFRFLFDEFPSSTAIGWSFRKLRSGYNGACIRVRRHSDDAEMDIYFVNNILDVLAIITFCGASNGSISIFYDQGLNGLNAFKTDPSFQPLIFADGLICIDTKTLKPAALFNGSKDLETTDVNVNTMTLFSLDSYYNGEIQAFVSAGGHTSLLTGSRRAAILWNRDGPNKRFSSAYNANIQLSDVAQSHNDADIQFSFFNYETQKFGGILNDNPLVSVSTTLAVPQSRPITLGSTRYDGDGSLEYMFGFKSETIIYLEDNTADATSIIENIHAFYGIY